LAAELLDKARKYYVKAGDESNRLSEAADLQFGVHRLIKRMERLQKQEAGFHLDGPTEAVLDSFTGGDFDSATRAALKPDSPRMLEMEEAINWAIDAMESGHEASFRTWRQRWAQWRRDRQSWARSAQGQLLSIADRKGRN
jgi:hypothetical protein